MLADASMGKFVLKVLLFIINSSLKFEYMAMRP